MKPRMKDGTEVFCDGVYLRYDKKTNSFKFFAFAPDACLLELGTDDIYYYFDENDVPILVTEDD